MPNKTIQQVQEAHTDAWMRIPGVTGTAIGQSQGEPCILVLTSAPDAKVQDKIPKRVQGYLVVIRYIGQVRNR